MKKISLLCALILSLFISAQKVVDTTQIVFPGRVNTEKTLTEPYVIFISVDGFRYDYIEKYDAENLKHLAKRGVWAKEGMYPSYPSSTFPNHYALITGESPSHNGLVDNVFYDAKRKDFYVIGSKTVVDGSWYGGVPLWALAETQGMRAASLFWVGSESDAAGVRPTYYYRYQEQFSGKDKARIIKNWLQLPEDKRPHFITVYFPEVDHAGHEFGPNAQQTSKAVHYIDKAIKELVDTLAPLGLPLNFILVSDHGMIEIPSQNYVTLPSIDQRKYIVVNRGTLAHIYAKSPQDIVPLYKALKKQNHKGYKIYLAKDFPKELNYNAQEDYAHRIGDILLVPEGTHLLVSLGSQPSVGKHGFDPYKVPQMKASFLAWGPAFKKGKTIKPFVNVNVYPLIAKILGLKIEHPIDGDISVLDKTLRK